MSFDPFHWSCPHCGRETIVSQHNYESGGVGFAVKSAQGRAHFSYERITCPSPECNKYEFTATLRCAEESWTTQGSQRWTKADPIGRGTVRFLPASTARVFPDHVPRAIRIDYEEACLIVDLSPKASATLARRALQGIVRDFWGATGRTLKDEIDSVQSKCDPLIWQAMTAVREVGNIGAHMERDIGLIVDVDADEAQLLIELIETLIQETYVAREARAFQMSSLVALAQAKKAAKKPSAT